MAYTRNPTWVDGYAIGPRIDAALLNHLEDGIFNAAATADAAGVTTPITLTDTLQAISLPPTPQAGDVRTLIITADGGTPSWDPLIAWDSGVGPTLATVTGERDVLTFLYAGTDWLGFVSGLFAALPDTEPPTTPTTLTATATSDTTVDLSWVASTDNRGVTGYEYRVDGGAAVDAFAGITETVTGLVASTLYTFEVRAYDAEGNTSGWSTSDSATTQTIPAATIADTFTRADSAVTLGSTETGVQAWVPTVGVYGIATNQAYLVSGVAADRPTATIDLASTDQDIRATTHGTTITSSHYWLLVGRWADKQNCYQLICNYGTAATGIYSLTRRVAGTNSNLYVSPSNTFSTGDFFRMVIEEEAGGTRIGVYRNGTQEVNYLDTNANRPATSTLAGIAYVPNVAISGDARWDDFGAAIP